MFIVLLLACNARIFIMIKKGCSLALFIANYTLIHFKHGKLTTQRFYRLTHDRDFVIIIRILLSNFNDFFMNQFASKI